MVQIKRVAKSDNTIDVRLESGKGPENTRYSGFFYAEFTNNAFIVGLKDGRRFFLEYSRDDSTSVRSEHIKVQHMPEGSDDEPVTLTPTFPGLDATNQLSWCDDVDHLNEHLSVA